MASTDIHAPSERRTNALFLLAGSLVLVALAIVLHAFLPRYEYRDTRGVPTVFDRWTGDVCFAAGSGEMQCGHLP